MKPKDEIEKLANEWSLINSDDTMESNSSLNKGYVAGYTQCQEDNKYSEEDIMNALHSVELKDNKDYSKIYNGMKEWFEQFKNKTI